MKRFIMGGAAAVMMFLVACGGEVTDDKQADDISVCGDGVMQGDEECDDGNTNESDDCSSCKWKGPESSRPVRKDVDPLN